jgi:hypothetical protein
VWGAYCARMTRTSREHRPSLPSCHRQWTAAQRLDHDTKHDPVSGCLIWQGGLNNNGYGHLSFKNRHYLAHRLAWITRKGPIPPGSAVCHRCDERRCVNVGHLFLATHAVNMADLKAKRRLWFDDHPVRLEDMPAADVAPIRVRYRGIEFIGHAIARLIDPAVQLPSRPRRPPSAASRKAPRTAAAPARAPTSRTRSSIGRRRSRTR